MWTPRDITALVISVFLVSLIAAAEESLSDSLSSQVVIKRDSFGVPHILGETEEAATFGYGYSAAEDRVLEIARLILKGRGEEAKFFGSTYAESDLIVKRFRNYEVAQEGYAATPPSYQRILDAYALGFSRYVAQHRDELPEWVRPIDGVDVIAHGRRVIVMEFCMNLRQIARIGREPRADVTDGPTPGSNMWAINKHRSASGNALLLGNPHLAWSGSQTWHEAQITVPGKVNYMGATLIGLPGLALGWNDHLGWSHTVNPHDCDDIYELTVDPSDSSRYLYEGRPIPFEKFTISVEIKDGETKSEDVLWTHYGPVVKQTGDKVYAYKSPSLNETRMFEQWYRMTKSRTLDEFRAALDMQALPMFNIAYADVDGNCFYLCNGRFPDRPEGFDWSGVVSGGIAATEWNTIIPQARLPQLLNPPTGYVQNSNSSPWYTNVHVVIDRGQYPASLLPTNNSLRSQHGQMLLEQNESITFDEILRDKHSMRILVADRVKPDLIKIATAAGSLTDSVEVLAAWDNRVAADSRGAVLFTEFWRRYEPKASPVFEVEWSELHPASTPHGIGDAETAVEALSAAAENVRKEWGALDIAWGDVHRLRHGDVDLPVGGGADDDGAFRIVEFMKDKDGKYKAAFGDSYVFAVEFSKPVNVRSILAYSQSGDPKSPHHDDQCGLFAANEWKPTYFEASELAQHTERTYRP